MKKIAILIFIFLFMPILSQAQGEGQKKATYFYSETCVHCKQVNDYFEKEQVYEKYDIQKIETSGPYNLAYLNKFFDAFNVPAEKRGIPVIFFENKMIIGGQPIIDSFLLEIDQVSATDLPAPERISEFLQKSEAEKQIAGNVSITILIWAALVDAINPCAFAVLILLVATVASSKGKRESLYAGLLFALAIFISYFLMGLGIYQAIGIFNLPQVFSIAIGILAVLIGLANLKDFFWYGKGFVMEVPFSWRPKMQAIIRKVSSPWGAFGVGFVVSIFLLPCTSGPYLVILGLLAQKKDMMRTVSLLALYNLIFIIPMVLITIGMYFGVRARRLEDWRQKNIRFLHLIGGAIMLFIGVYLIYKWI